MKRTVLLVAGEASGDEHGAGLATALRALRPDVRLVGTGGPLMEAAGVELLAGLDDLGVMGFVEVLPRLGFFRRLLASVGALMDDGDVALVVPIDFPGFNLRVARAADARGLPVLYYIPPKVWAWRPARARVLAECTDRVATILPFEADVLAAAGVRADYVGHPLLDRPPCVDDDATFRARLGIPRGAPILALLPGSREQEIRHHLELFASTAELVVRARPDVVPVVSRAAGLSCGPFERLPFAVVDDARSLLRHAHAALVKSGTATLEAALEGTPMVVAYRTSAPTWLLAKALLRTRYVSLPNLVAGAAVVPELLQGAATRERLAGELLALLEPKGAPRTRQIEALARVRQALGTPGAAARVAGLAAGLMAEGGSRP